MKGVDDDDTEENLFVGIPCKKHPYSSSIGICAECLKERLVKLVCSECGEQRLSSCSCSDFSSYQESSCITGAGGDVGSVGRISFLIDNEKKPRKDEVILLRRSSSSRVDEVKKYNGFSKIKRFFKKRKEMMGFEKDCILDDKNEVWVSDILGVSRSRSLCSFRGNGCGTDDGNGSDYRFSSAKISDATTAGGGGGGRLSDYDKDCGFYSRKGGIRGVFDESEPRKNGFKGVLETSEPRNSGYSGVSSDSEPRKSGFRGLYDEHELRKSGFSAISYDSDPRKSGYRSLLDEPTEARKSGFRGLFDEQEARKSGFSAVSYDSETRKSAFRGLSEETEARKSGCRLVENTTKCEDEYGLRENSRTHGVPKNSDFQALDDSAFIDLNMGSTLSKTEIPLQDVRMNMGIEIKSLRHLQHNGGSCRISECLHKKESTSSTTSSTTSNSSYNKVWKWLSKHYSGSRSSRKKCEDGKTAIFFQKI